MQRSRNYVIAAVLAGIIALFNTVTSLWVLPQGAHKVNADPNGVPYIVSVFGVIGGLVGLVAAYGVFRTLRWAVILTMILTILNALVSLPGILFAPNAFDQVDSAISVVLSAAIIWLLLRRDARVDNSAKANV